MHRPFTLYTRKNSKGKNIYYARFRDRHGLRTSGISIGQTSKVRAETWASEYLTMLKSGKGNVPTIKEWGEDFFLKSEGWILSVKSKGKSVTPRYCRDVQTRVDMHIIPFLGHIKLSSLVQADVVDFRTHLYKKGYQGSTINHILSTLRTMLNYAVERGIIDSIPTIERVSTTDQANRGILTPDEAQRLFLIEWEDQRAYTANLLSAVTGMRSGEVSAFKMQPTEKGLVPIFDYANFDHNSVMKMSDYISPMSHTNMMRAKNETVARKADLDAYEEDKVLNGTNPLRYEGVRHNMTSTAVSNGIPSSIDSKEAKQNAYYTASRNSWHATQRFEHDMASFVSAYNSLLGIPTPKRVYNRSFEYEQGELHAK